MEWGWEKGSEMENARGLEGESGRASECVSKVKTALQTLRSGLNHLPNIDHLHDLIGPRVGATALQVELSYHKLLPALAVIYCNDELWE